LEEKYSVSEIEYTVVTTHSFTIKNINVKITFHIQDRDNW